MFASCLFVLWKIFGCASHVFGALRTREACGPLLLRGHGSPHGFPIPPAFALCQTSVNGINQGVSSALRLLVERPVSPTTVGQTSRAFAQKCTCEGRAPPEPVVSVALQDISGDHLEKAYLIRGGYIGG